MNPVRRAYFRYLLRIAAKKHATGDVSNVWYGTAVTTLMFRLAGRPLKTGYSISPVDFELVVMKALGLRTGYQWNPPHLRAKYGPYDQVPTNLADGTYNTATGTVDRDTSGFTWDQQKADLAKLACQVVSPPARLEAWSKNLKETYPTLTAGGMRFFWLIIAVIVGGLATLLFTGKP